MVSYIAIIPARSGSKGLPDKNILMLGDKPLIAYTIEAAIRAKIFSEIIVSTDSLFYKNIAETYGAKVILRGKELSSDKASSYAVIVDVISKLDIKPDVFVLLQPTSPFRNNTHINEAIELLKNSKNSDFLVSVTKSEKSSELIRHIGDDLMLKNFDQDYSAYRRQNNDEYYPNGAIFIANTKAYLNSKHFFGPRSIAYKMEKSVSVDIDDRLDFDFAIMLMMKNNKLKELNDSIRKKLLVMIEKKYDYTHVTLIGHSIVEQWPVLKLNGHSVGNFGISGITSEMYYNEVLNKNIIHSFGQYAIISLGSNDITLSDFKIARTISFFKKIINFIKIRSSSTKIILLSLPPVYGRVERKNDIIKSLNNSLYEHFHNEVDYIDIYNLLCDDYDNLKLDYTTDGLHLSASAYLKIESILEKIIK